MGASGSSSDAQIFNHNKLKRRIENKTLGLPPPETLGPGRARSTLLPVGGRCLFPSALAGQAIQQMTTDQRGENSQLQDIQGQEGGRELVWKVQDAADHHRAEAKSC